MKSFQLATICLGVCSAALSQRSHPSPQTERTILTTPQIFHKASCAVVRIDSSQGQATGFYVSSDGDIMTAAHVAGLRSFRTEPNGHIVTKLETPKTYTVSSESKPEFETPSSALEVNPEAWTYDLARIRTGHNTACWLKTGDDQKLVVGGRVASIGFPRVTGSVSTAIMGTVSAINQAPAHSNPASDPEHPVFSPAKFILVQMPFAEGASGSPLLNEKGEAVGVLTISPGRRYPEAELLHKQFAAGAFIPYATGSPDDLASTPEQKQARNLRRVIGQLIDAFDELPSGFGEAVPLRYYPQSR